MDNICGSKNIYNMIVCPLFAETKEVVGMIQLVNKAEGEIIDQEDIVCFY